MSSFQLRIAGASPSTRVTKDTWMTLTAQAMDLAKRGYTSILIATDVPSVGLELHPDLSITEFNNNDIAVVPGWIQAAKADLEHQIQRTTT